MGSCKTFRAFCAILTLCAAAAYADCEVKITDVKLDTIVQGKEEYVTVTVEYSITPGANCEVVEATLDIAVQVVSTDPNNKTKKLETKISNPSFTVDPSKTSATFKLAQTKKDFCKTIDSLEKDKRVSGITLIAKMSVTCLCSVPDVGIVGILVNQSFSSSLDQSILDAFCQKK